MPKRTVFQLPRASTPSALAASHVEDDAVRSLERLGLSDRVAVHGHPLDEVFFTRQQLGLLQHHARDAIVGVEVSERNSARTAWAGDFDLVGKASGGNLTIQNTSGGKVMVDGNHLDRVFDINPTQLFTATLNATQQVPPTSR